ncbi:hypothetical protein N0V85_007220 [Neurospora sp. IMI 360204]|nr:hypothetical protein N0V85_007220 [Neurospora sp. IMI 360204]
MSEPRKTTMSSSPQAESGPEPGADSDQAQATLAPSLDDEASVSQSDEVPESADVPDDQDQHSEEEESRLCKAHRDAEEHYNALTGHFLICQAILTGPNREHLPRELNNAMHDEHLLQIKYREVWLKAIEVERRKEEFDKDLAKLGERHVELIKEARTYKEEAGSEHRVR